MGATMPISSTPHAASSGLRAPHEAHLPSSSLSSGSRLRKLAPPPFASRNEHGDASPEDGAVGATGATNKGENNQHYRPCTACSSFARVDEVCSCPSEEGSWHWETHSPHTPT